MAKYSRFDSRNKKRNKHKNQYLGRTANNGKRRIKDEYSDSEYAEKYSLEKMISLDLY